MAHKSYSNTFQTWMVSIALILGLFFCAGFAGSEKPGIATAVQITRTHTRSCKMAGYDVSYNKAPIVAGINILPDKLAAHKAAQVNYSLLSQVKLAVTASIFKATAAARRFSRIKPMTIHSAEPSSFL